MKHCLLEMMFHMCLVSWGGHIRQDAEGRKFHWVWVLLVWCTLHLVYCTIATTSPQNTPMPLPPWQKNFSWRVDFGGLFGQPMPIATHWLVGHDLPYRWMRGDWHGLAKMATKRHCHKQQCKTTGCHPLSLVDNVQFF